MVLTLGFLLELYQPLELPTKAWLEGLMSFRGVNQNCGGFFGSAMGRRGRLWFVGFDTWPSDGSIVAVCGSISSRCWAW